jgi:DNA-binding LacI/PurR family transcriptional regulator
MRDVAEKAGVSTMTVSNVIRRRDVVAPATRRKVLAAIKELGYRPNLIARSLRTQRTNMIAVMIADISNSFYHSIVRSIQDVARQRDYDVLIANTDHLYENEQHFLEALLRRPVDGIVMAPFHLTRDELDEFITLSSTAIVALGQHVDHPEVDVAYADDVRAIYDAVGWLARKGHRRIGYLGGTVGLPVAERRKAAYLSALDDLKLDRDDALILDSDFTTGGGRLKMAQMLDQIALPTAVIACNDLMALGAVDAIFGAGLRVPGDISVIGFDNIPETTVVRPHLTTIAQFPADIGEQLANALFERIAGDVSAKRRLFEFPCTLIERNSTR